MESNISHDIVEEALSAAFGMETMREVDVQEGQISGEGMIDQEGVNESCSDDVRNQMNSFTLLESAFAAISVTEKLRGRKWQKIQWYSGF